MSGQLEKLLKDIDQGEIPPYVVVHGDDEMLISQAASKIAAAILPQEEREFNYDVLDGKELDFGELFSLANTYPFLKEKRLIVVKEAYFFTPKSKDDITLTAEAKKRFANLKEVENIFKEAPVEFTNIIFTASFNIKSTDPLLKLILKHGEELTFISEKKFNPQTDQTYHLAQEVLNERGKRIDLNAYRLILEKSGTNSRLILDELDKIVTYMGDQQTITTELVETMVVKTTTENVFGFLEHLTTKQMLPALADLKQLQEENNKIEFIVYLLIQHFRWLNQLKLMSEEGSFKKFNKFDYASFQQTIIPALKETYTGVLPQERQYNVLLQHPFVVFKNYQASHKFQLKELGEIMQKLETIDIGLKTSAGDPWFQVENLILKICGQPHVL